MFFVASKIFWMLFSPAPLLLCAAMVGVLLTFSRFRRFGRALALVSILMLLVLAMTPIGLLLAEPLENRFPQPPENMPAPDGIIILGGTIRGDESMSRGQVIFEDGERVVQAAILARRYPKARLVFTGGSGRLRTAPGEEASLEALETKRLLTQLGVDPARVTLEDRSRNTIENARFTAQIVHPQPGQRWLLVTSAFHIPRAMALFEREGFDVIAYPVGYRSPGGGLPLDWSFDPPQNLGNFTIAAKEWLGLLAYRTAGKIDHLFPGPGDAPTPETASRN
jgi:uncharacterized SAM-binding protein YcdF (DUF218 family)